MESVLRLVDRCRSRLQQDAGLYLILVCVFSSLSLIVEASILRGKGVVSSPLQHGEEKSLQSFVQEVEEEGGWAPFMPNITILIALMLFLVGGGRGGREQAESPVSTAQPAFIDTPMTAPHLLADKRDLYVPSQMNRCSAAKLVFNYISTHAPTAGVPL